MTTLLMLTRQLRPALTAIALFTLLCGLAYPAAIWALSRTDTSSAEGSILLDGAGCKVGSALLSTDPQVSPGQFDPFFHARVVGNSSLTSGSLDDPAASDHTAAAMAPGDPAAGLPSNKGPSNPDLAAWVDLRRQLIADRESVPGSAVPADAVTGSGSGLDPHISPEYAALQVPRVARENVRTEQQVRELVATHTDGRQFGILGQPRVRVTELNLALGLTAPACDARE